MSNNTLTENSTPQVSTEGKTDLSLTYIDTDGSLQSVKGCSLYKDQVGRYWLWSDYLEHNLAYKIRGPKEHCLLGAIDSLLFTIQLRDERIKELQKIADLATQFADAVKPDPEPDHNY